MATAKERKNFLGGCILLFHPATANVIRTTAPRAFREIRFSDAFIEEIDARCWDERFLSALRTLRKPGNVVHVEMNSGGFEKADALFLEMDDEYSHGRDGFRTIVRLKIIELMVMIFRDAQAATPRRAAKKLAWELQDVIRHIQDNYAEEFSLQKLASRCGLNRTYFSRAFKNATGTPLFEYINRIRVQKACLLLKRGNLPIVEIAYSVGYNNLSFFYRYFSKIMRMTPREYRTQAQK